MQKTGDFPGSPVVKTSPSNAGGAGSIPGQGFNIPHDVQVKNHVCGHVCNPNTEFMAVALSNPDSEPARGHLACEHPLLLWKTCVEKW